MIQLSNSIKEKRLKESHSNVVQHEKNKQRDIVKEIRRNKRSGCNLFDILEF